MSIQSATFSNCAVFIPHLTTAKVIKVYDGDSITVASFFHDGVYRFNIRIYGIDCPEIRSEKRIALIVRDELSQLIMGATVCLTVRGYDKYGRLLADIEYGGIDVAKWLLSRRYAVPYTGGKKTQVDWDNHIHPRGWRRFFRLKR